MRESSLPLIGLLAILFAVGVVAVVRRAPAPPPVPDVSPAMLCADPDYHAGAVVRLRTQGMQRGDDDRELVYRRLADQPPCLRARFTDPVPRPTPAYLTGTCHGREGGCVLVADCRP